MTIADIIETIRELPHDRNARLGIARAFANRLRSGNASFDEDDFIKACLAD